MEITTNNVPREVLEGFLAPPEVRAEFDYLDWEAIFQGEDSASFFQYKGEWYDLGEFMGTYNVSENNPLREWDGVRPDSFFSALVVRYVDNGEAVIVGLALT